MVSSVTRLAKGPGTDVLEREYVYADPVISLTELADKYGLARSGVADKARIGRWYEKREAFRTRLADKTREAMAERWAEFQTANYERLMKMAATYLDKYQAELETGAIKVSTRDMLGIAAMMRTFLDDMAKQPVSSPVDVTPGDADDPETAAATIEYVKRLMAGGDPTDGTE